jgi:periplasmic protein TonB
MSSQAMYEQLDGAVEAMLQRQASHAGQLDPTVSDLLAVGAELRHVPNPQFRERLRLELQTEAARMHSPAASAHEPRRRSLVAMDGAASRQVVDEQILPTLFGAGYNSYPVHRLNFVASALVHAAAIALVLASSVWVARHPQQVKQQVISLISPGDYSLPPAKSRAGGGGGGGDRDRLQASKGTPPQFAREQITPPAIVVRNENPKLAAEPTVVGPPDLKLPQTAMLGDPLSRVLAPPSNGTGSGGGIGSGEGGGVGSGVGPGVGSGRGGGYGGGVYRVGGGVSAPRVVYDPDPEYSEEARQAKYQGTVVLWVVIGPDGHSREIRVQRALGMGLDQKAMEAVRKWRFEPAMKDGRPVAVQINVEVNFRLY